MRKAGMTFTFPHADCLGSPFREKTRVPAGKNASPFPKKVSGEIWRWLKKATRKKNFFPLSGRPHKLLFLSTSRSSQPVYVEFVNSGGCYSKIGRAYWPFPLPQAIYLGRCADYVGHIKHEMMHTLGFYHEHSRQVCKEDDALRLSVLNSNFSDLTVTCSSRSTGITSGTGGRTSSTHSGENLFEVISKQGHY